MWCVHTEPNEVLAVQAAQARTDGSARFHWEVDSEQVDICICCFVK
jgi:hypothetical protein